MKTLTRLAIPCLTCLAIVSATQSHQAGPEMKPITIDQPEWGAGIKAENAQAVCVAAAKTFLKHGGVAADEPILVRQNKNPEPIALTQPAPGGERVILLATSGTYWSQLAYQFSHEYCHVFTRHWTAPLAHNNMWFAESLCELASLWCLDQMGGDWLAGEAPYPNWKPYGQSLKDYVATRIKDVPAFENAEAFAAWLTPKLDTLYKDRANRDLNRVVAVRLLPLFRENPSLWQALPYINGNIKPDDDFPAHLQQWHDATPAPLRPAIAKIAATLGFPLIPPHRKN